MKKKVIVMGNGEFGQWKWGLFDESLLMVGIDDNVEGRKMVMVRATMGAWCDYGVVATVVGGEVSGEGSGDLGEEKN
ncbi:hypothetical protein V6N13_100340 [Hibiscus sabdariffa]